MKKEEKSDFMFVNKFGELEIKTVNNKRVKFLILIGYSGTVFGVLNFIGVR